MTVYVKNPVKYIRNTLFLVAEQSKKKTFNHKFSVSTAQYILQKHLIRIEKNGNKKTYCKMNKLISIN